MSRAKLEKLTNICLVVEKETELVEYAINRLRRNPAIHVLGRHDAPRLPIISFVIFHQSGRLLHYNFVCCLLNDLFGIQSRGGCVCAGPYGQQLLGIEHRVVRYKTKWSCYSLHFSCVLLVSRPSTTSTNCPSLTMLKCSDLASFASASTSLLIKLK